MLNKVTTDDLLAFIIWLSRTRKQSNAARARHVASLKSFFKYLHSKKRLIDNNPAYDLETPKIGKRNPKYLTLEQSQKLLDYCLHFTEGIECPRLLHAHALLELRHASFRAAWDQHK